MSNVLPDPWCLLVLLSVNLMYINKKVFRMLTQILV